MPRAQGQLRLLPLAAYTPSMAIKRRSGYVQNVRTENCSCIFCTSAIPFPLPYQPAPWFNPPMKIASFITPHGYGHAARQSALLGALQKSLPELEFILYGRSPSSFFEETLLTGSWTMQELETDVGLVQIDPIRADLPASIAKLQRMYPLDQGLIDALAGDLLRQDCALVIADIAPMGIAVAKAAALPVVLVENFTWDWIYQPYQHKWPAFVEINRELRSLYAQTDYHIKTEPWCCDDRDCLKAPPICRPITLDRQLSRQRLGVSAEENIVLITHGGTESNQHELDHLNQVPDVTFVVPGATRGAPVRRGNLLLLPRASHCYHPNLINTADVVIGKLGYSTIAEIHQAGTPFGYICRDGFRESGPLAEYVEKNMGALHIDLQEYESGAWVAHLPELLALPRGDAPDRSGADIAAAHIRNILENLS